MTVRSVPERLLSGVVYFAIGVLVGALGTFTHRARIDVLLFGGQPITLWQGIVVAILCVTCIGIGLRLYLSERWASYGYGVGVIVSIVCFAMLRLGGSVLVTDDLVSLTWLIAPPVIVAGIVAWPRLGERRAGKGAKQREGASR